MKYTAAKLEHIKLSGTILPKQVSSEIQVIDVERFSGDEQ